LWILILGAGVALDMLRSFNRFVDLELILLITYSPADRWDITRTLRPCGGVVFIVIFYNKIFSGFNG